MNGMYTLRRFVRLILLAWSLQPGLCLAEWSKEDRQQEKQQLDLWHLVDYNLGRLAGGF
jgi:hypothetical protein